VVADLTDAEINERKEYLRSTVTMTEVLNRFGITVKHHRCKGFCHNGKDYNMKVFRTGCHCFVCGKSFDIFDATMLLSNCEFWTAFELLGGTEKQSFTAQRKAKTALRERQRRIVETEKEKNELHRIQMYITAYRELIASSEPFSDLWCECINQLQLELYHLECMTGGDSIATT
jgi:hypothetical protein